MTRSPVEIQIIATRLEKAVGDNPYKFTFDQTIFTDVKWVKIVEEVLKIADQT